jgi:hypothetical protein
MRIKLLAKVAASVLLALPATSFAQNSASLSGSCDTLIGPEKERCLHEGGTIEVSATSKRESSEVIRKTQEALAAQGYDPGPIDGRWTQKTEQALKQAQEDREFEPTGRIDQRTLASLGVSDADNPFMRETEARASPAPSRAEPSSR